LGLCPGDCLGRAGHERNRNIGVPRATSAGRRTSSFYDAVVGHVARVVAVNTNQFTVIRQSVKKTDPHDARALAV
jgi:hypothetical protein